MMNKDTLRQYVTLLITIVTIVVNGLANALPFNGLTTGEISDRFQVYFVPAAYVFSIWGLIYAGLIAFTIYQLLPSQRTNPRLRRVGSLYALTGVANMAWLFLWHYEYFILTIVAMLALLLLLITIYLRLNADKTQVKPLERWCLDIPFSIYLSWITVATIANITSVLDYVQWSGWGVSPEAWTLIMLIAGFVIASTISLARGDIAYTLVIIWAFVGIAVKHAGVPLVTIGAWATAALVAIMLVVGAYVARQRGQRITPLPTSQ